MKATSVIRDLVGRVDREFRITVVGAWDQAESVQEFIDSLYSSQWEYPEFPAEDIAALYQMISEN